MAVNVADLVVTMGANLTGFSNAMDKASAKLRSTGQNFKSIGSDLTLGLTLPLAAAAGSVIKAASNFESSFAGVRKTVDATEAEFAALSEGMRSLSKVRPLDVNELNRIGEAAGQLGIEKQNILDFTATMADLAVTTNLTSQEAATSFARIANVMQVPQKEFSSMGSSVVELGNNFATTEAEIVSFATRIAPAGKILGLTVDKVLGMSAALSSVGINAEAGGTAISRVMIEISKAVGEGGKNLEVFAGIAGTTTEGFVKDFKGDAVFAVRTFIEGLAQLEAQGTSVFPVLEDLGLNNIRVQQALLAAASAGGLFKDAIEDSSVAYKANTALTEEASKRYKTFESQVTLLWNRFKDISITVGGSLIPAFKDLLISITPLVGRIADLGAKFSEWFQSLSKGSQQSVIAVTALVAALGPLTFGLGVLVTGIGAGVGALGSFAAALLSPISIILKLSTSLLGLSGSILAAMTPIMAGGFIVAGIVAGVAVIVANWEALKQATLNIWNSIAESVSGFVNKIIGYLQPLIDFLIRVSSAIGSIVPQFVKDIGAGLGDMASTVKEKSMEAGDALVSGFKIGTDIAGDLLSVSIADIVKGLGIMKEAGMNQIAPLFDRLKAMLSGFQAEGATAFNMVGSSMTRFSSQIKELDPLFEKLKNVATGFQSAGVEAFNMVAFSAGDAIKTVASFGTMLSKDARALQTQMTIDVASESSKRIIIIEEELKSRIASIREMKDSVIEQEKLISQARTAAKIKKEMLNEDIVKSSRDMELRITSNMMSEKNRRLSTIQVELEDRIRAIKQMGVSAVEQERLITLAMQSAAIERQRINDTFFSFWETQLQDIAKSNVFTLSTITTGFSQAVANWIQGVNTFAQFFKNVLNSILTAIVNFFVQWAAQEALQSLRSAAMSAGILSAHTAAETAKTSVTGVQETARLGIFAATNKVMLAGAISSMTALGAVGNAAMTTMGAVVTAAATVMAAIAAALAASVVGSPFAPPYAAAAIAVGAAGGTAVATGLATINASVAAAVAAATTALAVPFKDGGIVTKPTFGLFGEAGAEAVIPLDRFPLMDDSKSNGSTTITVEGIHMNIETHGEPIDWDAEMDKAIPALGSALLRANGQAGPVTVEIERN